MKIFITVDNKNGISFNKRRQSRDVKLVDYILSIVGDDYLLMNSYSFELFKNATYKNITVDDDFLSCTKNAFYFVENQLLSSTLNNIDVLYLCKWNRNYPSDKKLDFNIKDYFEIVSSEDIIGKSHEKITIEKWVKL